MDNASLITILAMAGVTYLTRAGGPWLIGRLGLSPAIKAWLNNLPGPILIALIAPSVLASGPAEALAGLAALGAFWVSRSLPAAMAAGVVVVWGLRNFVF